MPAPLNSTLAVRDDLLFQPISHDQNPPDHAELTFTIDATVECWSLHLALNQEQYSRLGSATLWLTAFRTDMTSITVKSAGDYLIGSLSIGNQPLSQGYVACRFPNADADKDKVAGNWTAQVTASSGGRSCTSTSTPPRSWSGCQRANWRRPRRFPLARPTYERCPSSSSLFAIEVKEISPRRD